MTKQKNRTIKVFHSGAGGVLGLAPSLAAFCRMTGAHPDYTSETSNTAQIEAATAAGEGFYLKAPHRSRGSVETYSEWDRHESQETIEQRALEATKAILRGHNRVEVRFVYETKEGWGKVWRVYIDGSPRGFWFRMRSRWELMDETGANVTTSGYIVLNEDGSYERNNEHSDVKVRVAMHSWSEREALVHTHEAWYDESLPSLAEQVARASTRKAKQEAEHARDLVLKKLALNYDSLVKVIEQAAQQGIKDADILLADIARGNELSAKWFKDEE